MEVTFLVLSFSNWENNGLYVHGYLIFVVNIFVLAGVIIIAKCSLIQFDVCYNVLRVLGYFVSNELN